MLKQAASLIASRTNLQPLVGVVLGSGLGAFGETLGHRTEISYSEIPGWPQSTAVGHAGKLVIGLVGNVPVAALSGRAHLYEGYTAQQAVYGIRTLHSLGVKSLVLTNAAGGIQPAWAPGTLALISDHINLLGQNPLSGPNDATLGPRFPDMSEAYSRAFREIARGAGKSLGIDMPEGVYAAVPGPSYETPAEIRYLRAIGADLVGMSTVPETIAANHVGMKVLGISCVTNHAAGVIDQKLNHEEVLAVGERMKETLTELLRRVIPQLV